MAWSNVLMDTLKVSYSIVLKMVCIMVPILIAIECLKDMGFMEKIAAGFKGVARLFSLPGEAALGVIAGLFAGLVLGSGVIIQLTEEVKMSKIQINTMFIFVGICHSIIEETLIFVAIGANIVYILLCRLLLALTFCFIYIWTMTSLLGYGKEQKSSKADSY